MGPLLRPKQSPSAPSDPAQHEVTRPGVHGVEVAAAEAAGQEDALGALDEVGELLLGDAAADDAVVRLVALTDPSPSSVRYTRSGPEITPT